MVKLRCQLCRRTVFHAKPTEMWICPTCEETHIFDVMSISQKEIHEMYEGLDYREGIQGHIKIEMPSVISRGQGIYVSLTRERSIEDAFHILPLLFDRVLIRNLHLLPVSKINSPTISNLLSSGIVVPIAHGFGTLLAIEKVKPILSSELMNHTIIMNLITSLAYEDMSAMNDDLLCKLKKKLRTFYSNGVDLDFYGCLGNELEKYNFDLLVAMRTGFPMVLGPLVDEIHSWKMKRVAELYGTEVSEEVSIIKRFLRSLDMCIPKLTFDDITSFRKEKACTNFRNALFSLSKRFQHDSSSDMAQDLLIEFYRRKMEFNELANSYAEKRVLLLTGAVSTLGGLLGGPVGAMVGGLGTSLVSPVTKVIFRKLYEDTHKDWAYFFWKWQKKFANK